MSIRREQILIRVRTVLCDLEYRSEGQAMSWENDGATHTKPGSSPPRGETSELDRHLEGLEKWLVGAERACQRGGSARVATPAEIEFRIITDYVGRNSERVAEDEGCTQKYVEDVRAANQQTRRYGQPRQRESAA